MSKKTDRNTVLIRGMLFHYQIPDPDGHLFVPGTTNIDDFLKNGFIYDRCVMGKNPKRSKVGKPVKKIDTPECLMLDCKINADYIKRMGKHQLCYGMAGIIKKQHSSADTKHKIIDEVEIESIALLPISNLTDPRCVATIIDNDGKPVKGEHRD